ncbi:hypothetical protein [Pseudoxanthomonas putridarboris]|uniref:Uncharacterized protein n=1 Tax=Pseudoxanthomonas putridarboris TaxID=752605 RepID=A0ABU9IYS9_9GAMM
MKNIATRMLLIACLVAPFAACKKEEAPAQPAAAPLVAPTTTGDGEWKEYLVKVVDNNMGTITNQPYMYYLPAETDPEFEAKYGRQLEQAKGAVARGVSSGNLIAFGSPASTKIADLAVAAFEGAEADSFKGVRVLFIGQAADSERVQAAVTPSGAEYVFVEAK